MLGAKRFAGAAFHAAIGFVFIRDVIFIGILTALAFVVHERGVINFKHGGYGYPAGAGQAVFTVGARHRREGFPGLARLVYDCQVFAREAARVGIIRAHQVLFDLLHSAHPRKQKRDLRLVPDPLQRPVRGRPVSARARENLRDSGGRRIFGEPAAAQRFHYNHRQTFIGRGVQTFLTSLVVDIHVVVLNLTESPVVVAVQDIFEDLVGIVEGKTEVSEFALRHFPLCPVKNIQVFIVLPEAGVQGVQQIKIEVVGLEAFQLGIQKAVHIRAGGNQPGGQFGRQMNSFAVAA